ncbi:transglutaminase-like domain-containing protein [Sporobacter termitidis]|nr:transglutaminase-like domain-containing protein [Sporobacter termitidis]
MSFPLNELNKNADGERRQAARAIDSFRYDAEEDTAPEGDFSRLSEYPSMSDAEFYAARYTGDIYYLRGYVGETYTSDGWVSLEPGRRAEYAGLFSWLHNRGFYAQNQQSVLRDALGRDTEAPVEVSVVNAGAYSKYLYAPYEAAIPDEPDIYRIGDENLLAGGFRGEREYKLILSGGTVSDYELLYNELNNAFGRGDTNAVEYLKSENGYRDFVYENYLEIPEEARSSIQDFLDGFVPPEDGLTFNDAKAIADSYINSLPYSDMPEASYYKGDFITDFLSKSREGNSLQFSTVETLLFRYLGIPARYVEGYILTEDELETAKNGGAVTIRPESLRAWTEIYRDGVGFVPFELDPPELYLHDQMMTDQITEPEPPEDEHSDPHIMLLRILLLVLAVIVILLAAGFAIFAIRRAYIRRHYKRILTITDNSEAVSLTTAYLIWVVSHAGIPYKNGSLHDLCPEFEELFGRDMRQKYAEVIGIQQQAIFSDLVIYDEERAMVTGFLNEVVGLIGKQAGLPRRFRLKWVDCVI